MLSFELLPLPSAIFDEYGDMRESSKAQLLRKLAVWSEGCSAPEVQIIDGSEMLYHTRWPTSGTMQDLVNSFTRTINVSKKYNVIVVFDRYIEGSIKTHERFRRTGSTVHPKINITLETHLPSQDSTMKNV